MVRPGGNRSAQAQLRKAMNVVDANWRGIGVIPSSGYALDEAYISQAGHVNPGHLRLAPDRRDALGCHILMLDKGRWPIRDDIDDR